MNFLLEKRLSGWAWFLLAIGVLILGVSSAGARSPVEAMEMSETLDGRPLTEAAAAKATAILSTSEYAIAGSWQALPLGQGGRNTIRIYLIAATSPPFMIMVPYNCGCIFLQPGVVAKWLDKFTKGSEAMKAVDETDLLSFMLLHEVGHIAHGDVGHLQSAAATPVFNLDETRQKVRESAADDFAASALDEAFRPDAKASAFTSALQVELALTDLSWNLSVIRTVTNFGATTLCSKFVFADNGFTHPNFELRILSVNARIAHSYAANELLTSFETCRRAPSQVLTFKDLSRKP